MNLADDLLIGMACVLLLLILIPVFFITRMYFRDSRQEEHAVLRNYPVLGKMRYIIEKLGPELRQYLYNNNNEGKPFSRNDYQNVVIAGKYNTRLVGFGSQRNFDEEGVYIKNALFPKQWDEMKIDNSEKVATKVYQIDKESLISRKEHREETNADPFYLHDDDAVILGEKTCRYPFKVKGLIGQSAMSYGALGDRAITALSKGLGLAGGTWMNTGEGGLSDYHLKGNVDIIMQIGPGLFGVRTKSGEFSWEEFKKKSEIDQIKAFEIKLAQGAKARGGHVDGKKVTEEIARIRNVEPWKTVDSPNRFKEFSNPEAMFDFIEKMRDIGGKPVGVKLVVGDIEGLEEMVAYMASSGRGPDFITIDGGEGGTGATFQELADSVGLPIRTGLPFMDDLLKKYGIRDKVKLIASGKMITPDRIAVALAMGADLINIARGFMIGVGCIMAQVCQTNNCPVGVATTDPHLQKALSIEEKKYRVCNYLLSLRHGLFILAAAAGIDSPVKFNRKHIIYKDREGRVIPVEEVFCSANRAERASQ